VGSAATSLFISNPSHIVITLADTSYAFEKIPTQLFRHDFESARMHIQGQCAKAEGADRKARSFRAIDDGGAPVSANRTLAVLKTMFKFYVRRDKLAVSPAELVDRPAPEQSRDRTLSDDELRAVWKAADAAAYPFGRLVQMLLLTGARRDEVREAPWSEFDLDGATWLLPAQRSKNGKAHEVPLSGAALQILSGMPRIRGRGLLFTTTGDTPFSGLSKGKARLDTASGVTGWTLHDLRRTAATGMAELGVPPHVIEAALNHVSGDSKRGVAGIYNRARYAVEIRKALQAWADHIDALVNGAPVASNVVKMR
jgi:integrase